MKTGTKNKLYAAINKVLSTADELILDSENRHGPGYLPPIDTHAKARKFMLAVQKWRKIKQL